MLKRLLFAVLACLLFAAPASPAGISGWDGSSWRTVLTPYGWDGSTWRTGIQAWGWDGSAWRAAYSTIIAFATGGSGSNSGAASSGPVSVGISSSTGGFPIGTPTHSWSCVGGDCAQGINNVALQNPTISKTVGSASCQSGANSSATWQDRQTDPATGISSLSNGVGVSLTWNNTTSCIGPFTVSASNSNYDAGQCSGGASRTCSFTWTGSSTVTISGGPVSGNMSYSWTYVSGYVPTSTSGTSTANFGLSRNSTCPAASSCSESSTWNVHVIDLVSGYSADAQAQLFGDFVNNTG